MDGRISAKEFAELKKVSPAAVTKWIDGGKLGPIGDAVVQVGRRYRIDPIKADSYLEIHGKLTNHRLHFADAAPETGKREDAPQNGPAAQKLDSYREATIWKIRYEALQKQHDYEISIGKYVLAEEVKAAAFAKGRTIRDILENLLAKLRALTAENGNEHLYELCSAEIKLAQQEMLR